MECPLRWTEEDDRQHGELLHTMLSLFAGYQSSIVMVALVDTVITAILLCSKPEAEFSESVELFARQCLERRPTLEVELKQVLRARRQMTKGVADGRP